MPLANHAAIKDSYSNQSGYSCRSTDCQYKLRHHAQHNSRTPQKNPRIKLTTLGEPHTPHTTYGSPSTATPHIAITAPSSATYKKRHK
jgi:hypothetical protein